jgi:hypothetical protein
VTRGEIAEAHTVFEQPWWLDAASPGAWDAVVVRHGDDVVARLPYVRRRSLGITVLSQPGLTPSLGPWWRASEGKYATRLQTEKDRMTELIEGLPPHHAFRQSFAPAVTNWLPFLWAGFESTLSYTYRLEDLSDLDAVRAGFAHAARQRLRRGARGLEVRDDLGLEALLELNRKTYARKGMAAPYEDDLVRRIDAACVQRGARTIHFAVDAQGAVRAASYVVYHRDTAFLLVTGVDTSFRDNDAHTFVLWGAIAAAAQAGAARFDFTGSVMEPVERFYRTFGARQVPYLRVSRIRPAVRPLLAGRDVLVSAARTRGGAGRRARPGRRGGRPS